MKSVLLGMSGGVDSSVSAILLKEAGYDVNGVTMKLWEEGGCCNNSATLDAVRVCNEIGIPHITLNYEKLFYDKVVDDFICCYDNCLTPNPCIECNKYLKFGAMFDKANELGIDYVATGHYAKVEYSEKYNRHVLKKSNNIKKDQSYVLYNIPAKLLERVVFPLGDFEDKEEVREIARGHKLTVASKHDSEDICFIPDGNYKKFLEENSNIKPKEGNIVNSKGDILGKHKGLYYFTIGQRRGLGIAYSEPLFVIGFNREKNEVIVGTEKELYKKEIYVRNINLLLVDDIKSPMKVNVKTRYSAKEAPATIEKVDDDKIKVIFDEQQARLTPGQSAVFYIDDIVVGGGKIC